MNAPDKVFFPNDINLLTKLSLIIKQKGDVCYIRKDALLDWTKERKEQMKIEAAGCGNMLAAGEYLAYDKMIEQIESM